MTVHLQNSLRNHPQSLSALPQRIDHYREGRAERPNDPDDDPRRQTAFPKYRLREEEWQWDEDDHDHQLLVVHPHCNVFTFPLI